MMLLTELFKEIPGVVRVEGEAEIGGLCVDSRRAAKSDLYFCQPGAHFDGHDFAMAAVRKGAAAVVVTHPLDVPVPQVQVRMCARRFLWRRRAFTANRQTAFGSSA
jgi:UDP-N-acetylmuramoyl-L-alanyl-D-glutamate--2,6-diaminopimelate ligase